MATFFLQEIGHFHGYCLKNEFLLNPAPRDPKNHGKVNKQNILRRCFKYKPSFFKTLLNKKTETEVDLMGEVIVT